MAGLRFCAYQYQHLPLDALRGRWRDAERCGFDVLWNCDTVVEPDRPRHTMFDGPATLTMMAAETHRIRVGTLVTSLYFRQPVTAAKAAVTVDHLSGGRVELALGVGDPAAGAKASGVDLSAGERVARFGEFVELVDLLLRQEVTTYHGQFYSCEEAETVPLPVQQPRPPVTIAAHGPKMLRIAAEHADGWSSWGGYDIDTEEAFYAVTADRSHRFDDLCAAAGRDPASIRHSLVCFSPSKDIGRTAPCNRSPCWTWKSWKAARLSSSAKAARCPSSWTPGGTRPTATPPSATTSPTRSTARNSDDRTTYVPP
jgi:alkanesulfonate monooxygenase SsuD/methylene tetrahydromethanopterin reductase-like flavin-dependent oxidoreductase (luciferase family)